MSSAYHTVHVRINGAATGQPTPVRVRLTGPNGEYLAPLGRLTDFAITPNQDVGGNLVLANKQYAIIDGAFEIRLPAGAITVEAHKGPQYRPLRQTVALVPGKLTLRFAIEQWCQLRSKGWYSGDTCAHFLSPHAALLEAMAEDVAVVNLLAKLTTLTENGLARSAIPNLLAFSGQQPALEAPGHMVIVNTYNDGKRLGTLGLLHCHRVVYPLQMTTDGAGTIYDWTLDDWCDQCHRKGGLVVASAGNFTADALDDYGEVLADFVHRKIDALETDDLDWCGHGHCPWYELLNCGLRVPIVGASGKRSNATALGRVRTYAMLGESERCTPKSWIEAVRAGRSFVTNGPLLSLTVDDQHPGFVVDGAMERVRVAAAARSIAPFERLEIVHNGKVVADCCASGDPCVAEIAMELPVGPGGWLAARCWGKDYSTEIGGAPAAHTSPIYLRNSGLPTRADPESSSFLRGRLEHFLQWIQSSTEFNAERQRQNLAAIVTGAVNRLTKNL